MKTTYSVAFICLSLATFNSLAQTNGPDLATRRAAAAAARLLLQGVSSNGVVVVPADQLQSAAALAGLPAGGGMQPLDNTPGCVTPYGLAAWWRGESDALDFLGVHNGSWYGTPAYAAGMVGLAFSLDGSSQYVDVADSSGTLNLPTGVSVEAWIYPVPPLNGIAAPVVKKAGEGAEPQDGYSLELCGTSAVLFWVYLDGGWGWTPSLGVTLPANQWSHVVGVYDGDTIAFYFNGLPAGTPLGAPGQIVPSGNHLQIGHDPSHAGRYFHGLIDEATVYNTALSAAQVQALYAAGSAGKCEGPLILEQPESQAVPIGSDATLSVVAESAPPLSYQWFFNGNTLAGQTEATLTVANAQSSDGGTYSVVVTGPYGSTTSDGAVLTVYSPACVTPPDSLVGWWAGEGNAYDSLCTNNGTFSGTPTFAVGTVGQAFDLDGTSRYVQVADSVSLNPTAAITVEAWVYPRLPLNLVGAPVVKKAGSGAAQAGGYSLECAGPNSLKLWVSLGTSGTWYASPGAALHTNRWSHVAGVYDGSTISLYVNGELVGAPTAATGQIKAAGNPLQIGHDPSNAGRYFNGLVDEASLYTTALSADQIQAMYAAGVAGKCNVSAAWQAYYFGPNYQTCPYAGVMADADGDGVSNLQECYGGTDPNKIRFSLSVTNQYVNGTTVPVQVDLAGGVPSSIALLVNTTNVSWQPFTSASLSVPTPSDGVYVVTVGLRGLAPSATETWQTLTLFRDSSPLRLALTNLPSLSGSRPLIDPAGYAGRALSSLTWTVVDANGATNSGNGMVLTQGWSLSDRFHTTNWFQCADLALALGANSITIQAVDWAGNVAVTNFTYVFNTNGDSTAPSLTLAWPQAGTLVSGDNLTVQAWTDDDTAAVALQYTDGDGMQQTVNGLVERGGNVWVSGVPLTAGTNSLSIMATDAAGNVNTMTLSVVQTNVALTIYTLSQEDMQYGYAQVLVAVDDLSCTAVTVNGVAGSSWHNGTWEVDDVPLPPGGVVVLEATAQLGNGATLNTKLKQVRDPIVFTQKFGYKLDYGLYMWTAEGTNGFATHHNEFQWARGLGGTNTQISTTVYFDSTPSSSNVTVTVWPADNGYLPKLQGQKVIKDYLNGALTDCSTNTADAPTVQQLQWMETSASAGSWPDHSGVSWTESSDREVGLFTGGEAGRQNQGLFDLSAPLNFESRLDSDVLDWASVYRMGNFLSPEETPVAVPPEQITLAGLGRLAADGHLWKVEPDGAELIITPKKLCARSAFPALSTAAFRTLAPASAGDAAVGTQPPEQKYTLRIFSGTQDVTDTNVPAVVGQGIALSCNLIGPPGSTPPPLTNYEWTIPGYAISNYIHDANTGKVYTTFVKTNADCNFYWVDGGKKQVQCTVKTVGKQFSAKAVFNVNRPQATMTAQLMGTVAADNKYIDSGIETLHFGGIILQQTNPIPGVKFTYHIQADDPQGNYGFIQVGSSSESVQAVNGTNYTTQGVGVDNATVISSDFYAISADFPGENAAIDAPVSGLYNLYTNDSRQDSYTMYLVFEPTDPADRILIPLKKVAWGWSGTAVLTNSQQNLWQLTTSNANLSLPVQDTIIHPEWTNHLAPPVWKPFNPPGN